MRRSIMKFMKRHFTAALVAAAGIWLAISAVHPRPASAGSLSTTVIGMFPFGIGSGAGDIYFMFIDSNTAAFGQRAALDKLLDVRTGAADSLLANDAMYSLVKDANGSGLIWAALNQDYTHLAVQQLLPQANQFPQAAEIVKRLKAMTIGVDASNGVDAHFQAICSSSQDANVLAAALQAGVMYRRYQETQSNPALADALNGVHITPSGDRLTVDAPVTQDQLITLIHSHALSAPM